MHPKGQSDRNEPQARLFEDDPPRFRGPSPEIIRGRLNEWLRTARSADHMPWDRQHLRKYVLMFRQMANWLPETERDWLVAEFRRELERQRAAG